MRCTMTKMDGPSLSLQECVVTLKQQLSSTPKARPKELACLYLAAVGLCCHLKKDQATLYGARQTSKALQDPMPCPSPKDVPAVTTVIQDTALFQSLLTCLRAVKMSDSTDASSDAHRQNRKRSYSIGAEAERTPSKMMKFQQTPWDPPLKHPTARYVDRMLEVPKIPLQVLAASILYSAFQHVDHWPVPLVQVYAEDAFGQRLWVDDERCSLFVQNLALCHTKDLVENAVDKDPATLAGAARVVRYYEQLVSPHKPINESSTPLQAPPLTTQPQGRDRSMSIDSEQQEMAANEPSDSDSDNEGECLVELTTGRLAKAGNGASDGESSSSGEEDEVVVMNNSLSEVAAMNRRSSPESQSTPPTAKTLSSFPGTPLYLNLKRIRYRYIGINLDCAHKAIAMALSERLDVKSKQNSKLLLALPSFVCIPAVRRLITRHLERWLQSPALSAQARALFAATVQDMRNIDPPLSDDVQAIDNILGMRLKANQLNMHIDNVTVIARRIPNVTVCHQIYLRILLEELALMEIGTSTSSPTEPMRMAASVYGALPARLSCTGIATALLTLLEETTGADGNVLRRARQRHVKKIRSLVRSVASTLGSNFDGCGLIESILSSDTNDQSRSFEDENDKAQLLFECATLLLPTPSIDDLRHQRKPLQRQLSSECIEALRPKLKRTRKLLTKWCCDELAPRWQTTNEKRSPVKAVIRKRNGSEQAEEATVGAGPPDYGSVLDNEEMPAEDRECLNTMRCVLFMADAESPVLREFLYPEDLGEVPDPAFYEDQFRAEQCGKYGSDLDDEMLWIVLKSAALPDAGIDPTLAIALLELLFERCTTGRTSTVELVDPELVWALYHLVEYVPSPVLLNMQNSIVVPRLAYPGLWWRVTALALIMCGASPERVGIEMWKTHPTLQALIKMVTSGMYRFPTVDCDEGEKEKMKTTETRLRDEESRIAEELFLPPLREKKIKQDENSGLVPARGSSRVSVRQREKQERLQKQQKEKEAALGLAEANRRKKELRMAQKSIMLWDPRGLARKPPRESVSLILSVAALFGLSTLFQRSVDPDFLLMTIGQKTRGAIERAFDWLIPVISSVPEIIMRLPASASCFLLLRAYGEGGKSELRKLSSPLLDHVRKSLIGEFGEADAVRAADLLLSDMAGPHPDRRRCARRVLREALGHLWTNAKVETSVSKVTPSGLLCLLQVQHAEAIVARAIELISQSLAFERGKVLCTLVFALDKFISFAGNKNIAGSWNIASILCDLISRRQSVCSEAMDRYPDFLSLAIKVVHDEFCRRINDESSSNDNHDSTVAIQLCENPRSEKTNSRTILLPLALLQSMCVLLSVWNDGENQDEGALSKVAIQTLADAFMFSFDHQRTEPQRMGGIAGVTILTGEKAVSVEMWVMLAKARSDFIARRVALSAPTLFLPRLMLCSGLPSMSLLTMVDRLGKLGDNAEDREAVYKELFSPSATNEWAALYPGNRRVIARKLVGRLSAYLRLNRTTPDQAVSWQAVSWSFLEWLIAECSSQAKEKKAHRALKRICSGEISELRAMLRAPSSGFVLSALDSLEDDNIGTLEDDGSQASLSAFTIPDADGEPVKIPGEMDRNDLQASIEMHLFKRRPQAIEAWLENLFQIDVSSRASRTGDAGSKGAPVDNVCIALLKVLFESNTVDEAEALTNIVLKWVPTLSESRGSPLLWSLLFTSHPSSSTTASSLRSRCAQLWCKAHIAECQRWILSKYDGLCIPSIIRFLVITSGQPSVHIQPFFSSTTETENFWGETEQGLMAGTTIALMGAKEHIQGSNVNSLMDLPDWLVLLLILVRSRKGATRRVCEMLLRAMEMDDAEGFHSRVQSAILRLYACYPMTMKLGDPKLRAVLLEAANSTPWLEWRSALDSQLEDMFFGLHSSASPRLVQAFVDLAKRHPLLLSRHMPTMVQLLDEDAAWDSRNTNARGRLCGENLGGPRDASMLGKPIRVNVRHWGYSFTESLWLSLLDVLMSIPREVLYNCGPSMGFVELLEVYAKLMFIQCQLQSNPVRLKNKYSDMLREFKSSDPKGWESWLASPQTALPSLGNIRNVLMSCSLISPSNEIESTRDSQVATRS